MTPSCPSLRPAALGQQGIEAVPGSGGIVPGQDGLDYGALGKRLTGLDRVFAVRFEVVHVETQDVLVLDGVGDGVFVQGLLEQVFRGLERLFLALDALVTGVVLEDGRAGEAEQLGLGERSEEHTSELQSLMRISYAVICLKKKHTYSTSTKQRQPTE